MTQNNTPEPYFPENLDDFAPWVAQHGLRAPYGECQCGCGEDAPKAEQGDFPCGYIKGLPKRYVDGHNRRVAPIPKPPNPSGLCLCGCGQPTPIAQQTNTKMGFVKGYPRRFISGHAGRNTLAIRFWAKVERRQPDQCWLWLGKTDNDGYGKISHNGQQIQAHRASWIIAYGEFPESLHVLHRCDHPPCCNPAHLFLGTNEDNIADKIAKNRQKRGEQVGNSKLTEADVIEIRRLYQCRMPKSHIARRFDVSDTCITYIVRYRNWAHVP